jgi:hypothetical protein
MALLRAVSTNIRIGSLLRPRSRRLRDAYLLQVVAYERTRWELITTIQPRRIPIYPVILVQALDEQACAGWLEHGAGSQYCLLGWRLPLTGAA